MREKFKGWNPFCEVKSDALIQNDNPESNNTRTLPSSGQMNDQE